jgi:oxaloacetate decarboxylase gamma subunit
MKNFSGKNQCKKNDAKISVGKFQCKKKRCEISAENFVRRAKLNFKFIVIIPIIIYTERVFAKMRKNSIFFRGGIMTISEMLGQSGILTLMGMGVVFLFLIIMILSMTLLHAFIHAMKWDEDSASKEVSASVSAPVPSADNGAVVAAIVAALEEK